ncbi:hypothetical protein DPMN_154397 [Dreissena polymorpha]|uniref:Uncharacterized protein n=1 Tax=Dreissena polymorpha TaxID=45954 RepID=A0A9D4FL12_DREPO|nr:hypothetical protein DPMN_154397 [Dreissena polymorpha]
MEKPILYRGVLPCQREENPRQDKTCGVRLATVRPRVQSPPWDLLQRHQVLVLGPENGLESVYISRRLSTQSS